MQMCEMCGSYIKPNEVCWCQEGAKEYTMELCYELGAVVTIKADTHEEAEKKVNEIIGYSGLKKLESTNNLHIVHRNYWTQSVEEK